MFSIAKSIYLWYIGRAQLKLIQVENRKQVINYLESNATRLDDKKNLTSCNLGIFSSGNYFYENDNQILIRYETKYIPNYWVFYGRLEQSGARCILRGYTKGPFPVEFFCSLALVAVLFGASSLVYMPLLGRSIELIDVLIVMIGFPLFLILVRVILGVSLHSGTGFRSENRIIKMLDDLR